MKKELLLLLIIMLLFTGCGKKKLYDIFMENNYIDAGGVIGNYEVSTKIGKIYTFDPSDTKNNYFAYSEIDNNRVYYYQKGLVRVNECVYNVDDGTYSEDCKDEDVEFAKKTIDTFKEENKRLGITLDKLNIIKDELY